ncbi:chromate transporter [Paenibacillus sp. HB172176]|uniref:chromate transporter n=1 Tax=Paenibacillus sp. HB172176 TaxID=2493690 RepID=UPI00143BEC1A|nr:chromate transporter [Paenibacillus sp. HB172176]
MNTQIPKPAFLSILWSFLKLSPISFGGGYAIFPAIEREIVERKQWLNHEELAETLSLAAAAPGGVGVNAAFLLGFRLNGVKGGVAAGIGMILPTFLIVLGMFFLYSKIGDSAKVKAALMGVTWGVMTLILFSALRIGKSAVKDKFTFAVMVIALACLLAGVSPVYMICAGILIGVGNSIVRHERKKKEQRAGKDNSEPSYMYFI